MRLAHIITNDKVAVHLENRLRTFSRSDPRGAQLVELLDKKVHDIEAIKEVADLPYWVTKHSFGRVTIDDHDQLRLDGKIVDFGIADTMLEYIGRGADTSSLVRYIERVALNPNPTIATDLYAFLKTGELPLTSDGCFLAFKGVRGDYRSKRSGKEDVVVFFDHEDVQDIEKYQDKATEDLGLDPSHDDLVNLTGQQTFQGHIPHPIGATLVMDKKDVDWDRSHTCSRGLHACSSRYLDQWYDKGDVLLIVKVFPEAVAAIPEGDRDLKLRTASYMVMGEVEFEDREMFFKGAVDTRYDRGSEDVREDEVSDFDDDEDEEDLVLEEALEWEGEPSGDDALTTTPVDVVLDDAEVVVSLTDLEAARWRKMGHAIGLDDGEGDAESGAEFDDTCPNDLTALPQDNAQAMKAFEEGYAEGYAEGYPEGAKGEFSDLNRPTLEQIKEEAERLGRELGREDKLNLSSMNLVIDRVTPKSKVLAWVTNQELKLYAVVLAKGYAEAYLDQEDEA